MSDDEKPQTALAKASADRRAMVPIGERGIALQNLDDLMKFAELAVETLGQKGMTKGYAAIAIQAGLERGLGVLGGLQAAVVINNVLSWRGWAAVGFIQNSSVIVPGSFKSWVEGTGDDRSGYCTAQRKGYGDPFLRKFSVKDAKVARLWTKGGPWESRPDNMLEWRAIGDMARFHFGDVMGNLPIAEDVEAGGYGPPEQVRELPSEQRPAPPSPIRDPILAELVPIKDRPDFPGVLASGAQAPAAAPQTTEVEATLVEEPQNVQAERRAAQHPNMTGAMSKDRREKSPETQAVINKQVDEVFAAPEASSKVDTCQRCKAKLNAMGGCDTCGWPGEKDFRE